MPVVPAKDVKRELVRKLVETAISPFPNLSGPYVAMLNIAYQPKAKHDIAAWRTEIVRTGGNIEKLISSLVAEIKLSDVASALAFWLCKTSERGRSASVTFGAISAGFPDANEPELEDACGELEAAGLIVTSAAAGHKVGFVAPTNILFETFDPIAREGANPRMSAAWLARYLLEKGGGASAQEILDYFGWAVRDLNPALSIVCDMMADGRKSAESHPDFVCRYVMPGPAERARFRQYADSMLGTR